MTIKRININIHIVFRRLSDDLLDGKIFIVGMTQVGGFKVQKLSVKSASRSSRETSRRNNDTGEISRAAEKMAMGKRQELWELGTENSGTTDGCGARHETLAKLFATKHFAK